MDAPGIYSLGDFQVAAAATQSGDPVTGFEGMLAASISARLAYGSGGTTAVVVVATSLDQGGSWIDIARFDFATAGAEKAANLSGLTPRTTPYAAIPLAAEGSVDGIFGDRFKATVTSVGVYAGSTVVSVRMSAR